MKIKLHRWHVLFLLLVVGTIASCGEGTSMSDYVETAQSGIKTLPWPKEMEQLFGDGDHFITHYGFSPGPKEWNSEVFFGGRYTLTLQVDVVIEGRTVAKSISPPKFYLSEVEKVVVDNGGAGANFSGQWVLDEAQWKKLVQAKGDWSVIGIPVKTNSPVPGFENYVKGLRAPRMKIPH
jgi:hypothetical protein